MEPREIYTVLFDARGPFKEPFSEWHHVGDAKSFDEERFNGLIPQEALSKSFLVAVSRSQAQGVEARLLGSIVREYSNFGEVRACDTGFHHFIQVNPVGVAKVWDV